MTALGRHRRVALASVAVLAVVAGAVVWTARTLVWPTTDEVGRGSADAVVALAGGGPRVARAEVLVQRGVAPLLVVSDGGEEEWDVLDAACAAERAAYEVRCFTPDPATTGGEARAVARLAHHLDLDSVVVVTSPHHAARAELRVARCAEAEVLRAITDQPTRLRSVVREAAGLAHAWLFDRGC
jgi:uncharacterized SAM-binding protein YcdF (DUF218 family)